MNNQTPDSSTGVCRIARKFNTLIQKEKAFPHKKEGMPSREGIPYQMKFK